MTTLAASAGERGQSIAANAQRPLAKDQENRAMLIPHEGTAPEILVLIGRDLSFATSASTKLVRGTCLDRAGTFQEAAETSTASAILIWNANRVDSDGDGDLLKTSRTQLRDDLRSLSRKAGGLLLIQIQYSGGIKLEKDIVARLKHQLIDLANTSGYPRSQVAEAWTSTDWSSGAGSYGTGLMEDSGEENRIITRELVAVPIRTNISRLHAGNADVIIKLRRPFDAYNLQLSDQAKIAISHAIESMDLKSARKLHFQVSSTKAGAESVDMLFSNRQPPEIPDALPPALKQVLLKERESFKISPALEPGQSHVKPH